MKDWFAKVLFGHILEDANGVAEIDLEVIQYEFPLTIREDFKPLLMTYTQGLIPKEAWIESGQQLDEFCRPLGLQWEDDAPQSVVRFRVADQAVFERAKAALFNGDGTN
jgi:hypothetical protein